MSLHPVDAASPVPPIKIAVRGITHAYRLRRPRDGAITEVQARRGRAQQGVGGQVVQQVAVVQQRQLMGELEGAAARRQQLRERQDLLVGIESPQRAAVGAGARDLLRMDARRKAASAGCTSSKRASTGRFSGVTSRTRAATSTTAVFSLTSTAR